MNDLELKQDTFPEISSLGATSIVSDLINYLPEHKEMICEIKESLPEIQRATSLFNKTQSQFMDNMLTVSHPTPLRNLRQILAEMNRTREALKESHFKCKKKEIELKMKERDLLEENDELRSEMIKIEIMEIHSQLESSKGVISGAIRKLTNYTVQYKSIVASLGVKDFNEIDFEAEEEKYHIKKAFDQALIASRSRGGVIDEGNMIYLTQLGINGASAQNDIRKHLIEEGKLVASGYEPDFYLIINFLESMSKKYSGCSKTYAKQKGMTGETTEVAAIKRGDLRLIKSNTEK